MAEPWERLCSDSRTKGGGPISQVGGRRKAGQGRARARDMGTQRRWDSPAEVARIMETKTSQRGHNIRRKRSRSGETGQRDTERQGCEGVRRREPGSCLVGDAAALLGAKGHGENLPTGPPRQQGTGRVMHTEMWVKRQSQAEVTARLEECGGCPRTGALH